MTQTLIVPSKGN